MVLAVTPGQADHRGRDGEQLRRLHRRELEADGDLVVLERLIDRLIDILV